MIPVNLNSPTYYFTINHITREANNKYIYGVRLNHTNYFLSKTTGLYDCEQLDNNPKLNADVMKEFCDVITEVERKYKKRLSVELFNSEVFRIISRLRTRHFAR
jgi:hypothetical protein